MTIKQTMIQTVANRTNKELINDWVELDKQPITQSVADVRELYMNEIEKRFPAEFDVWMDCCESDDDIRNYIKL